MSFMHPCSSCGVLVGGARSGRCDACEAALRRRDERRRAQHPRRKVYGDRRWRVARTAVLRRDGACVECGATKNLSVDHVVPVAEGGASFDIANLRTLCLPCHGRRDGRRAGRAIRADDDEELCGGGGPGRSRDSHLAANQDGRPGPPLPNLHPLRGGCPQQSRPSFSVDRRREPPAARA
jgi:5-methylcytosine-specific restriction enzyme A